MPRERSPRTTRLLARARRPPTHAELSGLPINAAAKTGLLEAAEILNHAVHVTVTSHVNPDGDAVGSILALAHGLKATGATVDVLLADAPPDYCSFLPGFDWLTPVLPANPASLAVVVDAAGLDRIGHIEETVKSADQIIEIDHHSISRPFGQVRAVDETASSTAEMIYYLFNVMRLPLSPEMATCLMMGLVTDTGAFRFTNVNANTLDLAAKLLEKGADMASVMDQVYDQKSIGSLRLLERALAHLHCEGGVATTTLSIEDFKAAGALQAEAEGIVGQLRSLAGVKIAAVLRESEPSVIRVSLRGRPGANVAELAAQMGGGGHAAAAGCTINLPLERAEAHLRRLAHETLRLSREGSDTGHH